MAVLVSVPGGLEHGLKLDKKLPPLQPVAQRHVAAQPGKGEELLALDADARQRACVRWERLLLYGEHAAKGGRYVPQGRVARRLLR